MWRAVPFGTHQHLYVSAQRMRRGVQQDIERQRRREENKRLLEEQIALQRRLEARSAGQQPVDGFAGKPDRWYWTPGVYIQLRSRLQAHVCWESHQNLWEGTVLVQLIKYSVHIVYLKALLFGGCVTTGQAGNILYWLANYVSTNLIYLYSCVYRQNWQRKVKGQIK